MNFFEEIYLEMVRAERLHETATDEAEKKEATAIYSKAEAAIKELGNTACRIFRIFKDSKECGNPYLDINDFHKTFCIDSRLVPMKSNPDFFFSCGLCCEQVNSVSDHGNLLSHVLHQCSADAVVGDAEVVDCDATGFKVCLDLLQFLLRILLPILAIEAL